MVELFCVSLSVFAALAVSHWIEHRTGLLAATANCPVTAI